MTDKASSPVPGTNRRILSIWCTALAIDRWQLAEGTSPAPFALVSEVAHGLRLSAANAAAEAGGVRASMMLTDARALCPNLAVAPGDPAGDLAFLERLALWAQRWGPWSALDPPDGLLVDVTGVAHLYGGEPALLHDAAIRLASRGLAVRLALAPTAGAAWALSHHGPEQAIHHPGDSLDELPVAALRLDPATRLVLHRLGLKRVGELSGVARDALARRFRTIRAPAANPLVRLDQLVGRVPEPMLPVLARPAPSVQRRLAEPIRHRGLLDRVVEDLAADLVRTLEGAGLGARRIELALWKVDGEVLLRKLELAEASREAAHLTRLFAARLDDLDAGFGIELARLSAPWCEPLTLSQRDLEAAAEVHGTSLAACIDRLSVRLGTDAVRRPEPCASHWPERAQRWVSLLGAPSTSVDGLRHRPAPPPGHPSAGYSGMGGREGERAGAASSREAGKIRPLKLLDRAEPIAVIHASPDGLPRRFSWRGRVHEVLRAEGPERIAPEWWRERGGDRKSVV